MSAPKVSLRDVSEDDLPAFFEFQHDAEANLMAAFTAKDPSDRDAFEAHWRRILDDALIIKKTIVFDGSVAGNILSFERSGERKIGYWLGKEYWGDDPAPGGERRGGRRQLPPER